jgi:hypothetical protein
MYFKCSSEPCPSIGVSITAGGQQVVVEILKSKCRNRQVKLGEPSKGGSFAVNSLRAAEPVNYNA